MAKISKETYNQRQKIDRMFPQGVEAKEVWFQGDCIFKLNKDLFQYIYVERDTTYAGLIEIGDYVVMYSTSGYIRKFKDGEYSDRERIIESLNMYVFPIQSKHTLYFLDRENYKLYCYQESGLTNIDVSQDFVNIFRTHWNSINCAPFVHNGYLVLGSYMDMDAGTKLHNYTMGFRLNSDYVPTEEIIAEHWGNPSGEIIYAQETVIGERFAMYSMEYDEATDSVLIEYPYKIYHYELFTRFVKVRDFNLQTFFDDFVIKEDYGGGKFTPGSSSMPFLKYATCLYHQKFGSYSHVHQQEGFILPAGKAIFGVVNNYPQYIYTYWNLPTELRYNYLVDMSSDYVGFYDGTYYMITNDNHTTGSYLGRTVTYEKQGYWAGESVGGMTKLSDFEYDEQTYMRVTTSNSDGFYYMVSSSSYYTQIIYIRRLEEEE